MKHEESIQKLVDLVTSLPLEIRIAIASDIVHNMLDDVGVTIGVFGNTDLTQDGTKDCPSVIISGHGATAVESLLARFNDIINNQEVTPNEAKHVNPEFFKDKLDGHDPNMN